MKKIGSEITASLLVILFVYAGLSKLMDYSEFRFQLGRSPYITEMAGFIAWFMPSAELLAALLLTFKRTRILGFYGSFLLMVLFTGYIYAMLYYSPFLPCSCGGVLSLMNWEQHFYFNIFFVLVALAGIFIESKSRIAESDKFTESNFFFRTNVFFRSIGFSRNSNFPRTKNLSGNKESHK